MTLGFFNGAETAGLRFQQPLHATSMYDQMISKSEDGASCNQNGWFQIDDNCTPNSRYPY